MDDPKWLGASVTYQGLPLALRVRPAVDEGTTAKYPHMAFVTQRLEVVRSDGMPERDYNRTLADFDHSVHQLLEQTGDGIVMIVETFGGKRSYYACVAAAQVHADWLASIRRRWPDYELSDGCELDRAWAFYNEYRDEFRW